MKGLEHSLAPVFEGTETRCYRREPCEARARGTILMALLNKFGSMVMTTGNKSEMSAGYATLYGDMNGGFNPIKDLYKTEVFRLSEPLRNRWKPDGALGPDGVVIPQNIITKPPTAELRENQKDQDSPLRLTTCWTRSSNGWWNRAADRRQRRFRCSDIVPRGPHAQSRRHLQRRGVTRRER